ncbi:hypothetical protein MMC26_002464 [Xylographa opegraphella]|nr:hypothetical protein [Xylographa opegraphella]
MAPRITRGAAAKEAALLATAEQEKPAQQITSLLNTSTLTKANIGSKKSAGSTKAKQPPVRATPVDVSGNNKKSDAAPTKSEPKTATPRNTRIPKSTSQNNDIPGDNPSIVEAGTNRKRKRTAKVKGEVDPNELPHGLGRIKAAPVVNSEDFKADIDPPGKKLRMDESSPTKEAVEEIKSTTKITPVASALADEESPTKSARRSKKANPYGVTLGQTPYPDWEYPTPEQCQKVNDVLSQKHGAVAMPESIPLPSLTVAGCGEVPCVLEALLRTLLSAHTSNGNAAMAVQGLIKRFGVLASGMSKGCIDWNAARLAGREEIMVAIKRGGLAQTKSKYIEGILKMVHDENESRRAALASKSETSTATKAESSIDPKVETVDPDHAEAAAIEVASEIMLADTSALTLDYVHAMSANAAFAKLITFPGIGVKTASCTLLFCMQRPSFAVDTHVFRLCKWLGWVPPTATRDTTFAHCDVRVPDNLKYSLHQLLIKHGKECGRCRAITGEGSEAWEEGCVIDELVTRTGKKKGGVEVPKTSRGKKKVKQEEDGMDVEDEVDEDTEVQTPKVKRTPKATTTKGPDGVTEKQKGSSKAVRKPMPRKKAKKVVESEEENGVDGEEAVDGDDCAED